MIECSDCNSPNPPAGCPVDDEEEEEDEPEPCNTGDGTIDNPSFQNLMQQAAIESGFGNDDESERLEGFWAVYEDNGVFTKQLLPYAESGRTSCSFRISFGTVSVREQYLAGAVYLLHTHPYAPGEELISDNACLEARGWDVLEIGALPIPGFLASGADIGVMNSLNLPFIIIDKSRIYINEPGDALPSDAETHLKCGYN